MSERRNPRERGAMAVEFALCMPAVLLLILGGVHLGRVLGVRHRLAEATGYATRTAAVARNSDPGKIKQLVNGRMAGNTDCTRIDVVSSLQGQGAYTSLNVTATCKLAAPFGGALVGDIGPSDVSVIAAMPFKKDNP